MLAFDELDKQCANHFLARQVAIREKRKCLKALTRTRHNTSSTHSTAKEQYSRRSLSGSGGEGSAKGEKGNGNGNRKGEEPDQDPEVLRIKIEGWTVLAEAQSALAHSCIVSYNLKSARFEHLFYMQRDLTQTLQQKMEEAWAGPYYTHTQSSLSASSSSLVSAGAGVLSGGAPFPKEEAKHAIRQLRLRLKDYLLSVQTEILPLPSSQATGSTRSRGSNGGLGASTLRRIVAPSAVTGSRNVRLTATRRGGGNVIAGTGAGGRAPVRTGGVAASSGNSSGSGRSTTGVANDVANGTKAVTASSSSTSHSGRPVVIFGAAFAGAGDILSFDD